MAAFLDVFGPCKVFCMFGVPVVDCFVFVDSRSAHLCCLLCGSHAVSWVVHCFLFFICYLQNWPALCIEYHIKIPIFILFHLKYLLMIVQYVYQLKPRLKLTMKMLLHGNVHVQNISTGSVEPYLRFIDVLDRTVLFVFTRVNVTAFSCAFVNKWFSWLQWTVTMKHSCVSLRTASSHEVFTLSSDGHAWDDTSSQCR